MSVYKNVEVYQIQDLQVLFQTTSVDVEGSNLTVDESLYAKVFEGLIECEGEDINSFLENLYGLFLGAKAPVQNLFKGRRICISDVFVVNTMPYYCDKIGYVSLNKFDKEKTIPPQNTMNIVYVESGKPAYRSFVGRDLEAMQRAVGGYIEPIILEDDVAIIGYEEAKVVGLPGNRHIPGTTSIIAGSFFICGDDGENFTDLPEDKIKKYLEIFAEPENITNEEVEDDIYITLESTESSKSLRDILDDLCMDFDFRDFNLVYGEDNDEELNDFGSL